MYIMIVMSKELLRILKWVLIKGKWNDILRFEKCGVIKWEVIRRKKKIVRLLSMMCKSIYKGNI